MPGVPASRQGHQGQLEYRAPRGAADGLSLPLIWNTAFMSLNDEMHSVEELLDTALELFMELASDNLPEQEIVRFNQEFNDRGLLAETDPADDWAADVGFEVSDADYAEIWVGLCNEQEEYEHLFARMLLSRRVDEKFCHIEWLPQ